MGPPERFFAAERIADKATLERDIAHEQDLLAQRSRLSDPRKWAAIQTRLGDALASLGAQESGTSRLEEAVAAYHNALEEYTRDHFPLEWAAIQRDLGKVLGELGVRENRTARLEESAAAFRKALKEYTPGRAPLAWAKTQNNLAKVYCAHFNLSGEPHYFNNALAAIAAALDGYRKARAFPYIEKAKRLQEEIFATRRK